MSKKSLVLLTLLAVLPLVAFAWLGRRVARAESLRLQQQYRLLLTERLMEENRKLQQYFAEIQRQLSELILKHGDSASSLRHLVRSTPYVRQVVVLNQAGDVVHPDPSQPMSRTEREFLAEIAQMISDKDLVRLAFPNDHDELASTEPNVEPRQAAETPSSSLPPRRVYATRVTDDPSRDVSSLRTPASQSAGRSGETSLEGWFTWYWGRGVNLMYWRRGDNDRLIIVALSRARWMADILAALPDTPLRRSVGTLTPAGQRICLVDSSDQTVYQWGHYRAEKTATPFVETPVVAPLASWRLKFYVDPSAFVGATRLPMAAGLAGMACGLLGLVVVLYREYSRDMREAAQRVSFVNQVSHELKTPLTNIRLYADLLDRDLEKLSTANLEKPRSRLAVITSESLRLSRLITNVLTFARSERNQLQLRPRRVDLDELIRDVVERFRPALEADDIAIDMRLRIGKPLVLDPDVIEQILDNLISNVQRYAAEGKHLGISSTCQEQAAVVEVADRGPGIHPKLAPRVFDPFVRGSEALSDATGTGIGLSIARRLARLHGGDLTLATSKSGATFRLVLPRENYDESTACGR